MDDRYLFLLEIAAKAGLKSYSPYSKFRVGAALLTKNGNIYTGTNIENRSYSPSVCAERVAIFKAVSEGDTQIEAIAVVGLDCDYPLPPCGVCRQVLSEFSKDITILMSGGKISQYKISTIKEMYPYDALDDLKHP